MTVRIAGVGFNTGGVEGDLDTLERGLARMEALGCDAAEIAAVGLDAVIARRLVPERVARVREILRRRPFAYSLHAPIAINLMDEGHLDLQREAAVASLALAAEIGAPVVVVHPGRVHPAVWARRADALLARERDMLAALGDRARALGVRIAYENLSPNRRVIDGTETGYALDPAALAEQLAAVDHPAVVACLDVSHAQQGAVLMGFDMTVACRRLAPFIGHVHFSDSTGLPATITWDREGERHFFGVGDMHAPPGRGAVDFDALGSALEVRPDTRIVIELKANFRAWAEAETLAAARAFGARIDGRNS